MMETKNLERVNRMIASEDRSILKQAIKKGLAGSESEALRNAIREYGIHHKIQASA